MRSCDDEEHTPLRQGRERAERPCGWQRCGAGELREPHLPFPMTLQADHLRFLSTSHSNPIAATINTTMMLHGIDDVGSSLGVATVGFTSAALFDAGCCTSGRGFGDAVACLSGAKDELFGEGDGLSIVAANFVANCDRDALVASTSSFIWMPGSLVLIVVINGSVSRPPSGRDDEVSGLSEGQ